MTIRTRCAPSCFSPFGTANRLVYVEGTAGEFEIAYRQIGRPTRRWTIRTPVVDRNVDENNVSAHRTDDELVVSTIRPDGSYRIRTARFR